MRPEKNTPDFRSVDRNHPTMNTKHVAETFATKELASSKTLRPAEVATENARPQTNPSDFECPAPKMCDQKKNTTFRSVHRKCLARKKNQPEEACHKKACSTRITYRRVKVVTENARPEKNMLAFRSFHRTCLARNTTKTPAAEDNFLQKKCSTRNKKQHSRVHWWPTQMRDTCAA